MSELTTQDQAEEQVPARTVVVAEDEALIRLDIVEILKDQGFDVVAETDNGKTAVELAQKHRPDLVLMDVKMPIMDGITAAEEIAKEQIAPVVLLTAFSQKEPRNRGGNQPLRADSRSREGSWHHPRPVRDPQAR